MNGVLRITTSARVLHPLNSLIMGVFAASGMVPLLVPISACTQPQARVLNAVELAEWALPYKQELDLCRINAKKLPRDERFSAYVECEEVATAKACKRLPASARAAWSQCDDGGGVKP